MKAIPARLACCILLCLLVGRFPLFAQTLQGAPQTPPRSIAITIDDLPAGGANGMTGAEILEMTTKLLGTLHAEQIPVVGFVNEQKLFRIGEVDERIKALNLWLDNGFELGNHTYSHPSLNRVPLQTWEEEVIRGETVTRILLAQHKMKLRYFRRPYLDAGRDVQTRRESEAFLSTRGYQIAPITMDAWDWMYAGVYEDARRRGDANLEQQLVSSYLSYTTTVFDYYEKFSKTLLGYEPKEILLMHANWLEADHIGEVLELLRKRGYQFITLENALSDPIFSMPNDYIGEGTGWLDQIAITRGQVPLGEPTFPQWVIDKSREIHQRSPGAIPSQSSPSPY
jgi:peptidoglycan/xylan/chitin deacetylase (PgdA/CDA1 family)